MTADAVQQRPLNAADRALAELESSLKDIRTTVPRFCGSLYGEPGVGKTVLGIGIAQLITPPDKRILLIDTSDGYVSLRNHPSLINRVDAYMFSTVEKLNLLAMAIKGKRGSFANVGTIVFDEMSSVVRSNLLAVASTRERIQRDAGSMQLEEGALDRRDYGISQNAIYRMFEGYRNLDANLIVTAHSKVEDGTSRTKMGMSPGVLADLSKNFQIIGHMTSTIKINKETKKEFYDRKVQVHPTTLVVAKTRIGGFDNAIITPNELLKGIQIWLQGDKELTSTAPVGVETETNDAEPTQFTGYELKD